MVITIPGHGPTSAAPVGTAAFARTGMPLAVGKGIGGNGGRCPAVAAEGGIVPAVTAAK